VKKLTAVAVFSVVVAACGTGATTTPTAPSSTAAVSTSDEAPPASTATSAQPTATTRAPVEGPLAPDFTLTLADGSTFTLSQEQKPVYIIFWAEW
jgi:cytochrome oxidase Cu insertion factor (SCO1/SenC/PrrC family)